MKKPNDYHFNENRNFVCKCGHDRWKTISEKPFDENPQLMCRSCFTKIDYIKWQKEQKENNPQKELL